jgi:hypothetical protein
MNDPEQDEVNRRGIALCKLALRVAAIKRQHR